MAKVNSEISFRVGRVRAYRPGKIWYLCYCEDGQRRRKGLTAEVIAGAIMIGRNTVF